MALMQKGHKPKEWVVPVPPNNALADNKDIIELRDAKGKLYRVYSEAKIAEFRATFEKQLIIDRKNYDKGVKHREKQKLIAQAEKLTIKSSEKEGHLLTRGIQNPAVSGKYIRAIAFACQRAALPENVHTYQNGLIWQYNESVRMLENEERLGLLMPEEEFNTDWAEKEWFLDYPEIVALWELAAFRPRWADKTMRDWLSYRWQGRTDGWFLNTMIFLRKLNERAHRPIINHFVQDKTGMSRGLALGRDYDEDQLHDFLTELDTIHQRMLLYPRSFFKSTLGQVDLAQWLLCIPDFRVMVVTYIFNLSTKFMKIFKQFFATSEANPTMFQEVYPEFTTQVGEGKEREFWNPMARLPLVSPSVEAKSAEASGTGEHVHMVLFDDIAEQKNVETAELREKLLETQTSYLELADLPWGFRQWIGTRWSDGPVFKDPYGTLIDEIAPTFVDLDPCVQEAVVTEGLPTKITIGAALRISDKLKDQPLRSLKEENCILLWGEKGSKGSWPVLFDKMKNERSFRQQQLNQGVGTEDDAGREFDEVALDAAYLPEMPRWLPPSELDHYAFIDTRHFTGAPTVEGDESVGTFVTRHTERITGTVTLYVRHMFCTREDSDRVAGEIVQLYNWGLDHVSPPKAMVIEKIPNMGDFLNAIERYSRNNGKGRLPLNPLMPEKSPRAKTTRIVSAALRIKSGHLKFVGGTWDWEGFKKQALLFKGTAGHGRLDDRIDTVGMACRYLLSLIPIAAPPKGVPLGTPVQIGRRMTAEEQAADKVRQETELAKAYASGEMARNRAALAAMRLDRARIEAGQSTSVTQSEWQGKHRGGTASTEPINASSARDRFGNKVLPGTNISVNRYGIPIKERK